MASNLFLIFQYQVFRGKYEINFESYAKTTRKIRKKNQRFKGDRKVKVNSLKRKLIFILRQLCGGDLC